MIRTFRSGSLGIAKDKPLPSRLVVMGWGESEINGGETLRVNATTLAQLPGNQKKINFDRVALDFNHNSVEGSKYYKGEPVEVAGYATLSVIEGEGLIYEDIDYTLSGEERLRNGDYIDLSPAVKTNAQGEVIFLHSVAVCRQGQVRGLSILAADPFETSHHDNNNKHHTMDPKKLLLTLLCLSADASDQEITDAAEAAGKMPEQFATLSGTVESQAEEIKTLSASLTTLQEKSDTVQLDEVAAERIETLSASVESLIARDEARERTTIKAQALASGKIVPLAADKLGLEDFRTLCSELPEDQVPIDRRTPEHLKVLSSQKPGDAEADTIFRQLNVSADDVNKYNN